MGILNVTPDSFSDGNSYTDPGKAVARALEMVAQGAALIDIGGESSRPGAAPVSERRELARILPVIKRLAGQLAVPLSVDSCKPGVVAGAVDAGARLINDINGLRFKSMRRLAARLELPVVVMHMRGRPRTMQKAPRYRNVLAEVEAFLKAQISKALDDGVKRKRIIVDPGIGFGKRLEHNLALIRGIRRLKRMGRPVLIGASRKSLIGMITGRPVEERLAGSLSMACFAAMQGADILRVHDVEETVAALKVIGAIKGGKPSGR